MADSYLQIPDGGVVGSKVRTLTKTINGVVVNEHTYLTGGYTIKLDEAGGGVSYIGEAVPGTASATSGWRIKKLTEATGSTTVAWQGGTDEFNQSWDARVALSYS